MTHKKEFVLTILPTYNRARYLPEAIESVLAQDYPLKKILIINDGSTDETESVCHKYVKKYPRNIFYHYKQNGGCASARNYGLNLIDEDICYVCFLDDDDRLLPGKFSREVKFLEENSKADFSYADSIIHDEETRRDHFQKVAGAGRPKDFAIEHFLTNEAKPPAILYRADVLKNRRFREDQRYNEDSEFLQRIAIECRGVYSPEPSCWTRWHAGSKSRNLIEINKAILRSSLEMIESYPTFYHSYKDLINQRIRRVKNDLLMALLLAGRTNEAREWETSSLKKRFMSQISSYYRLKACLKTLMRP